MVEALFMYPSPSAIFYMAIGLLSAILQVLLISSVIRNFRKFPVLACYAIASFLATVMEGAIYLQAFSFSSEFSRQIYWLDEAILQVLVYLLVISLMSKGLAAKASDHRGFRFDLAVSALLVMAFCILVDYKPGAHYLVETGASRNLSFASAILNLILWMVLLTNKNRDHQLLVLSSGLGVQTTGRAIGHSLRQIPLPGLKLAGNTLIVLTYMISFFILWWALRQKGSFDRPQPKE